MGQVTALASEFEEAGVPHQMVTYSGAPHATTLFGSERYREDADNKSSKLFSQSLDDTLR